jgi:Tfp pilus assembly protein PilF
MEVVMLRGTLAAAFALALPACATAPTPSTDVRFTRAVLSQDVGDSDSARGEYLKLVQAGEANSAVFNNLAVITARQKKLAEARNWLEYAVATDPDDVIARANLGVVDFHMGQRDKAGETLREARLRRQEIIRHMPSMGRVNWYALRYAEFTEHADQVAREYLDKLAQAPAQAGTLPANATEVAWLLSE